MLVKDIKIFQKKKKNKYGCERDKNLSEGEKQKLVEYIKNIKWQKTIYNNYKKAF